jgi:ribonuclease HII
MLKPYYSHGVVEAGCDEAGRGCLAGPVFAAAVVLPPGWNHPLLDDSKKMTARDRDTLREIIEREATAWAVESVPAARIDEINILNASFEAMSQAVAKLKERPELLLIDGNRFRTTLEIPYKCIIGGDGLYAAIAAASVLAKTHRDEYMARLAAEHPQYGWLQNKGYPTKQHREAIASHGPTPHHRKSFRVNEKLKMEN